MSRIRIAVVDDDDTARRAYMTRVEDYIAERGDLEFALPQPFCTAKELIGAVNDHAFFDVILSDVYMPDERGGYSAESGGLAIKEWLAKRRSDDRFRHVQLLWMSVKEHVNDLLQHHQTIDNYGWFNFWDPTGTAAPGSFRAILNRMVEAIPRSHEKSLPAGYQSQAMIKLIDRAVQSHKFNRPLLLTGEKGSGKQHLARLIHLCTGLPPKRFVILDCTTYKDRLLADALHGHKSGAFTDAREDREGFAVSAIGGTLFLDEIGELSLEDQTMLNRFVQEREVVALGTEKVMNLDVRIIAATNQDVTAPGRFRQDLHDRFVVMQVPPLWRRREDIRPLATEFIRVESTKRGMSFRASDEVYDLLERFNWPGNVRELEKTIQLSTDSAIGGEIRLSDLPDYVYPGRDTGQTSWTVPQRRYLEIARSHGCSTQKEIADRAGVSRQAVNQAFLESPEAFAALSQLMKQNVKLGAD